MTDPGAEDALAAAFERLLAPLARLAVAKGLPYAALDDMLRAALVRAAHAAHPDVAEHRRASRVSASTGLHRREVQRLLEQQRAETSGRPATKPAPAAMVFAHWRDTRPWCRRPGEPLPLPRLAPAGAPADTLSFEALVHDVTRDLHPRAVLEELLRLNLAAHDSATDEVRLVAETFVPQGDEAALLRWLAANNADHLQAAVNNVTQQRTMKHLEQAIAADGLDAAAVQALQPMLRRHWAELTAELVPWLEAQVEAGASLPDDAPRHRVRVGLFSYDSLPALPVAPAEPPSVPSAARPTSRRMPRRKESS